MPDFLLPDLGEGLEEAEIIEWRVQVGDQVTIDQAVVEVETAKAAVEVPVPFAGTVTALHADPGATVAVGQPLVSVDPAAQPAEQGSGNVLIGYGTPAGTSTRRQRARRRRPGSTQPVRVISPLVRKLARDAGLDLTAIHGSGPAGVARRADIEQALVPPLTTAPAPPPAPATSDDTRIPL